ncbi:UDP-glycosyltransferase-14 [Ephemera danica]|nr:UDP-glycosyltransferase-14 [Ephemera danica]
MRAINILYISTITFFLTMSSTEVESARILVLLGFGSKSHNHGINAVSSELASKGHELTVVTAYPIKDPPDRYKQIDVPIARQYINSFNLVEHLERNMFDKISYLWTISATLCPDMLRMPEIRNLLKEKFDLVMVSVFFNDCFIPFAHHNKAPLILFSSTGLHSWVALNLGHPEPTSYVPNLFLPFSDKMSFFERMINTWMFYAVEFMRRVVLRARIEPASKQFYGHGTPHILDLERNVSLILLNHHVSLNSPRPLQPNVIQVGGWHINPIVDPLSKDLKDFMDEAKDGVIYCSMGTVVKPEDFPPGMLQAMIEAFRILPQRVIWKWNLDTMPGQPSNVKIAKFLPQQSILAHPNLRLFVTQGGLLSTQEAAYYGVPLVGIPMLGDQELNIKQSENIGIGIGIKYDNVTKMSFLETIQRVLYTPSYSEKAQQLKKRVRDQPQTPLERAMFWIEYVLRHEGAPHLQSPAIKLSWYQLYLLDVAAVLLAALLLALFMLRTLFRLLFGSKSLPQGTKNMKKRQ